MIIKIKLLYMHIVIKIKLLRVKGQLSPTDWPDRSLTGL